MTEPASFGRYQQARKERRAAILDAGMRLALAQGYDRMKRDEVARAAGVSNGTVNHEFGTLEALRDEVMTQAVKEEVLAVVARGLVLGHPIAQGAPKRVREAAVRAVAA